MKNGSLSKECPTLYCDARVTCTACACFVQGVARTTSGLARHLRLHVLAHHGRPLERESGDPASARSRLLHHSHARKSASYSFLRSMIDFLTLVFIYLQWPDIQTIGRDLARLLQDVARIPVFEKLWRDILLNPSNVHPQFKGA